MQLVVNSKALYAAAVAVSKVMVPKNSLIILDNFLLTVESEKAYLTASSLDNTMTAQLPVVETEGSGKYCLNARTMLNLLKELPDHDVSLTIDEKTFEVEICSTGGIFNLVAINGAEFPLYKGNADDDNVVTLEITGKSLAKGFENTAFAASHEDFREHMKGVYLDVFEDKVVFVATDTRKLARYTDNNIQAGVRTSCIVPVKAASVMRSVFGTDEIVKVEIGQKNAKISNESYTFQFSFLTGRYPDYNRVIPTTNSMCLTADRASMLNVVKRVRVLCDEQFGLMKFHFTADTMAVKASDAGKCSSASDKMSCSFTGGELTIGFNAVQLTEILSAIPGNEVSAFMDANNRPGLFMPAEQGENTELIVLLMPMSVNEF